MMPSLVSLGTFRVYVHSVFQRANQSFTITKLLSLSTMWNKNNLSFSKKQHRIPKMPNLRRLIPD